VEGVQSRIGKAEKLKLEIEGHEKTQRVTKSLKKMADAGLQNPAAGLGRRGAGTHIFVRFLRSAVVYG